MTDNVLRINSKRLTKWVACAILNPKQIFLTFWERKPIFCAYFS